MVGWGQGLSKSTTGLPISPPGTTSRGTAAVDLAARVNREHNNRGEIADSGPILPRRGPPLSPSPNPPFEPGPGPGALNPRPRRWGEGRNNMVTGGRGFNFRARRSLRGPRRFPLKNGLAPGEGARRGAPKWMPVSGRPAPSTNKTVRVRCDPLVRGWLGSGPKGSVPTIKSGLGIARGH